MRLPRGKFIWLGFLLAILTLSALTLYCVYAACPIRYQNFDRIQEGMTRAEVETLLGCPPGDHTTGPVEFDSDDMGILIIALDMRQGRWLKEWDGDQGNIMVSFDDEDVVQWKYLLPGRRPRPAWWRWLQERHP